MGRAGLVTVTTEGALFNYHIMRLRLSLAINSTFFLWYVRGAPEVHQYVRDVNHGATRDGINTEQLLSLSVKVPPLPEQGRIVEMIEEQFTRLDAAVAGLKRVQHS